MKTFYIDLLLKNVLDSMIFIFLEFINYEIDTLSKITISDLNLVLGLVYGV